MNNKPFLQDSLESWREVLMRSFFGPLCKSKLIALFTVILISAGTSAKAQLTFGDWQYSVNGSGIYQNAILTRYIGVGSDVSIPSAINGLSVQFLNNAAFDCNSTITNVSFPSSGIAIFGNDTVPFGCCSSLMSINVDPLNPYYSSADGVLFTKDQTTLLKYPMGKMGNYNIPAGVARIGTYAFYTCTNLTGVTIPNSVTNIESYGFYGCLGLSTVTIPASVTTIGDYGFSGCDQLTSILFLGNAPSVGTRVLAYNYPGPPKTIYYLPGTTSWGSTFAGFPTVPQTFSILHTFTGLEAGYGNGGLVASSNFVYGTSEEGGDSNLGTIFKIDTDGLAFSIVYNFTSADGGLPQSGLTAAGSTLYGVTGSGNGTVFSVNLDGTGFLTLYPFTGNTDEEGPNGGLVLSSNTLYGTTIGTTIGDSGTIFAVSADGLSFTTLHTFTGADGAAPLAGLVLSGQTLFGTTSAGGAWSSGTVFAINTDGSGFTNLYNFGTLDALTHTNLDGAVPAGRLLLMGSTLYGTASRGGFSGNGTLFKISTNGTDFSILHTFTATSGSAQYPTNADGIYPTRGLSALGTTLYGTAGLGGLGGAGAIFALSSDGSSFRTLHSFTATSINIQYTNNDGTYPEGELAIAGNTLYGSTHNGGLVDFGTVFSLFLESPNVPLLTIASLQSNLILSWPTSFTGFTLQSTTNISSPTWTTNLPAPVVVSGQYTVTNPISGQQQFFRLVQ